MARYRDEVYYNLKFLNYVPISFISAIEGKRVDEVLELLEYSVDQNSKRIKTGLLNEVITEAVQLREPPTKKGKQLKIYIVVKLELNHQHLYFLLIILI